MYFYSLIENLQLRIAAPKFEFGCGFYFCVIGALKYIIGYNFIYEQTTFNRINRCTIYANARRWFLKFAGDRAVCRVSDAKEMCDGSVYLWHDGRIRFSDNRRTKGCCGKLDQGSKGKTESDSACRWHVAGSVCRAGSPCASYWS